VNTRMKATRVPSAGPSDAAPRLQVSGVSHVFNASDPTKVNPVLDDVSFDADAGEFISIVGPSGCGKSTLLTFVSGLESPSSGLVRIDGSSVSHVRRDVGFVFQRDALLPWRTVEQNVALGLKYRGVSRSETKSRVADWIQRMGLAGMEDRFPSQISGGQRKRASIAATLVCEPRVLLMDEPLSALDVQTRSFIETDILEQWQKVSDSQTVLFVTHDLEEAITLSDRVIVLSRGPGRIIADYKIDLPRPRDIWQIRTTEKFREYFSALWSHLSDEVVPTRATHSGSENDR
jgi:NitT/TauT family transport system ATP-binding protein